MPIALRLPKWPRLDLWHVALPALGDRPRGRLSPAPRDSEDLRAGVAPHVGPEAGGPVRGRVSPRLRRGPRQVEHPLQQAFDRRHDGLGLVVAPEDAADTVSSVTPIEPSCSGAIKRIAPHPP